MIAPLNPLQPGGTASWSDAGAAYHPVPWAFFFDTPLPLPPPKKKVHRDSFRFSVSILGFLEGLLKKKYLEVLLEEFWPLWAVILLL